MAVYDPPPYEWTRAHTDGYMHGVALAVGLTGEETAAAADHYERTHAASDWTDGVVLALADYAATRGIDRPLRKGGKTA